MKKLILCVSIVCLGMMYSCSKDELVPEGERPSWLGASIYGELQNPVNLKGTFNTYMRLAQDLGYEDVLSRTGSKTIFPANDEAFERFFAHGGNAWGVTSYDQLTENQKKSLFYNSMLDNAILIGMLSNVSASSSSVIGGTAIKHPTNASVIDSVTTVFNGSMPQNNKWWDEYREGGIAIVRDNGSPMMVHFTRDYMLNHNITTTNAGINDFKLITGSEYDEQNGAAYIFGDKIIKGDVACQNGYIHQVEDVLVQPGNMAEVLEKEKDTKIYSHILNYFSAPYFDQKTTNQYNDWASVNGKPLIDKIYQVNYVSNRSNPSNDKIGNTGALRTDPNGSIIAASRVLKFDPGWTGYYPAVAQAGSVDYSIADIGALFVPTDEAMWTYFQPLSTGGSTEPGAGAGATFIEVYGVLPNTRENLIANLDAMHTTNPQILASFLNNLMFTSFSASVPSKFNTLTNDATDDLGMKVELLQNKPGKTDGSKDIIIANNGVIYKINKLIPPAEYSCVLQPASLFKDMQVMNWAIQDRSKLGVDFKFYLLASSANYRLFLPDDDAFSSEKQCYYIDPSSLGTSTPLAVRFYFDETQSGSDNKMCFEFHEYDKSDNSVNPNILAGPFSFGTAGQAEYVAKAKSLLIDVLNTHTILLDGSVDFEKNHYFMTKSGAGVYVDLVNGEVKSGAQIDQNLSPAKIEAQYGKFQNGFSYRLNGVIQPTQNSVYATLNPSGKVASDGRFSKFVQYCNIFSSDALLEWAGISPEIDPATGSSPQQRYKIFVQDKGIDYNVRFFNTFNYTVYAPNNDAVDEAIANGLPTVEELVAIYTKYSDGTWDEEDEEVIAAKTRVLAGLEAIRKFVRYHFQTTTVFADAQVPSLTYQTLLSDDMGVAKKISVSGGNGVINLKDQAGSTIKVDANNSTLLSNKIARDYQFDRERRYATRIVTSSHAAVHEIAKPLCHSKNGKFNDEYTAEPIASPAKAYKRLLLKVKNIKD